MFLLLDSTCAKCFYYLIAHVQVLLKQMKDNSTLKRCFLEHLYSVTFQLI